MKKTTPEFSRDALLNVFVSLAILAHFSTHGTIEISPYDKAYLDPGTGSMIISAIVGVFATIILGIKTVGYKIKNLFKPKPKQPDGTTDIKS